MYSLISLRKGKPIARVDFAFSFLFSHHKLSSVAYLEYMLLANTNLTA